MKLADLKNKRGVSKLQKRNMLLIKRLTTKLDSLYEKAKDADKTTGDYDLFYERFNKKIESELETINKLLKL